MPRAFGWLWTAYAVSTFGTWLAFDAFTLVAVLTLDVSTAQVSVLAASGLAVGAVAAIPLGPWVERRRKRPVMIAADLVRAGALASVPLAYLVDALSFGQLVAVAVVVGAADIAFRAASGAFLKGLLPRDQLLTANARFESTLWTATVVGPPAGGALIGLIGPLATVTANAASFVLSAAALRGARGHDVTPAEVGAPLRRTDLAAGWRYLLAHPTLRPLFAFGITTNALIMATAPLMAVLMLDDLGFTALEYAVAFGVPCVGGLVGSRLSRPLAARFGARRTLLAAGTARTFWPIWLAFVMAGPGGLALVLVLQFALLVAIGIYNPLLATARLEETDDAVVARTIAAWSISNNALIATTTALWGVLASVIGLREAVAVAGALLLFTPLLLPWRADRDRDRAPAEPRRAAV